MTLTQAQHLPSGCFIRHDNRLYVVRQVNVTGEFTLLVLRGVYFPVTLINMLTKSISLFEVVVPDCYDYAVTSWGGGNIFDVMRPAHPSMTINVPPEYFDIARRLSSGHLVTVSVCTYDGIIGVYAAR